MHRRSRLPAILLVALAGLCVIVYVAFRDAQGFEGRVLRRVTINGHAVGGLSIDRLDDVLQDVQDELDTMPIRVATPDGGFSTTGEALGVVLDRPLMRQAAFQARRNQDTADRLSTYVSSWFTTEDVPLLVTIPRTPVLTLLQTTEGTNRRDPVDPELKLRSGKYVVLPGSDGEGIDVDRLIASIETTIERGQLPPVVAARRTVLPSNFTTEELTALADRATALTSNPLRFTVNGKPGEVTPDLLRKWMRPAIVERQVRLTLDDDETLKGIRNLVGEELQPVQDARLAIDSSGAVTAVPSQEGLKCCTPESVRLLQRAFNGTADQPVAIGLIRVAPKLTTAQVQSLGVQEPIASFTTRHKAGEDRVKNIHRIADLTRGVVIKPGASFSVNEFIGERTKAKGFVEAKVIEDGVFKESFGGGISQYATTLFNAAFFAGMDIPRYKPHSIYIQRYPYGREATLSYPQVDLRIKNVTPYGIMIWPTYTASSITVTLYSTDWLRSDVEGDPVKTKRGECDVVVTTRLRVFPDERGAKRDRFKAEYLPGEGFNCDGSPTAGNTSTTNAPRTTPPQSDPESPSPSRAPRTTPEAPAPAPGPVPAASQAPAAAGPEPAPSPRPSSSRKPTAPSPAPEPAPDPAPAPAPDPGVVIARPPVTGVG